MGVNAIWTPTVAWRAAFSVTATFAIGNSRHG
jgi:hypothetical protein